MTLLLSIVALLAGPLVYALGRRNPDVRLILEGFVFITIAGIVCVFIAPHAIGTGGLTAVVFLLLGLLFPIAIERLFRRSIHGAHAFILVLAALGLVVHAIIDGVALLPVNPGDLPGVHRDDGLFGSLFANQLALGVILHRLPVGMAIWWSLRTTLGVRAAAGAFALIIVATVVAYFLGEPIVDLAAASSLAWFQAFVSGSLVHVVAFGVSHDHEDDGDPSPAAHTWAYRVGILIGMFVVFTVPHIHP